ncbi:DUF3304 domain-containing protein [Pseudomonas sp. MCal1]|uniref:DUF3304 domain-containing protein n=1 Tax=Pseudomonas sp. MCal1 TaxID=2919887 RepID=UPI002259322F|nr:DUF3304 domain-containing protein [Pseudomonas sp. MCal1]MCX4220880.1 DUF3304 domain-containing protein [Pseudomonas sp. MCal1]
MTRLVFLMSVCVLMLQGCFEQKRPLEAVYFEGFSHTSSSIPFFFVEGHGIGAKAPAFDGGNEANCCFPLPVRWYPGLSVVVTWAKEPLVDGIERDNKNDGERKNGMGDVIDYLVVRTVVELERYEDLDDSSSFQVHFLPCGKIEILPGPVGSDRISYPDQFPRRMDESHCSMWGW